jgi:hypothetical protein
MCRFVIGIHSDVINKVKEYIIQDVVLVDLDNNLVNVPSIPETRGIELPPESTQLVEELKKFFQADLLSVDSPSFNPYASVTAETNVANTNAYIQVLILIHLYVV